jgi:phospholipid/cholesterol/gamma-HCH transport system ATP-binding protein
VVTPAGRTPFISFKGVSKAFGRKPVLEDIHLDIYEGETLVILGRSGSGKTVMTSMLVGLNEPDRGEIIVGDWKLTELRTDSDWLEFRLKTGYLFQGSALFDSMTVGENVAFPMFQHTDLSPKEIARRVHEKLGQVGLADVEHLEPAALSGGMQRRAALARSLALDPHLIIYDEPTSGLDPITGDGIGRLIRHLQEALKVTSIVVSHDLRLTETVADRLTLLYESRMVFLGTFEEFVKSPHPEVRRFLRQDQEIQENKA